MQGTILCVDDDANVLKSLQRTLMPCADSVLLAYSAEEALALIDKQPIDVVICDLHLPDKSGYETLNHIRNLHPEITRLVLSADTSKDTIMKLVLDGTASIYLQKPWKTTLLQRLVEHLISIRQVLNGKGLRNILSQFDGLPALPQFHQKIVQIINNGGGVAEIAPVLEQEPTYAAMVLKVVNSAIYGVSIGSIRQSMVYLGLNTIKNIVLTCEVFNQFSVQKPGCCGVTSLWTHANLCNYAFHALHRRLYNKPVRDEMASAGLLHDIGHLAMMKYFPESCDNIKRERREKPHMSICDIERRVIGVSHSELGALILDMWNLPSCVIEACLFHHDPTNEKVFHTDEIAILCTADYLARVVQKEAVQKEAADPPPADVLKAAGIELAMLEDEELLVELATIQSNLSL